MNEPIRFAVLTVSDRCSRGETTDTSGPTLVELLQSKLEGQCFAAACVPDEVPAIADAIRQWSEAVGAPDLIVTTGGTGLAPRDVTPEATRQVIEREHMGLMEIVRLRCYEKTPRAFLSRGIAGTCRRSLVINLPGSVRGATESLEALLDILPHAIETLRGDVQDDGRPDASATSGKVITHKD